MTNNSPNSNRSDRIRARRQTTNRPARAARPMPRSYKPEALANARESFRYRNHAQGHAMVRNSSPSFSENLQEVRSFVTEIRPTWRWASLAIVLICTATLFYFWGTAEYYVYSINLAGARYIPGDEIYRATGIHGYQFFYLDPAEIERNIEALPGIASATVVIEWPHITTIEVVERQPVVVWSQSGDSLWADTEGITFPVYSDNPHMLRILVEDSIGPLAPGSTVPVEVIESALHLRSLRPNIEALYYEANRGLSYQDGRGWRGYFGIGSDMDVRLTVYERVIEDLEAQGIWPRTIDVTTPSAPVYLR